jgi:hypothetical protein
MLAGEALKLSVASRASASATAHQPLHAHTHAHTSQLQSLSNMSTNSQPALPSSTSTNSSSILSRDKGSTGGNGKGKGNAKSAMIAGSALDNDEDDEGVEEEVTAARIREPTMQSYFDAALRGYDLDKPLRIKDALKKAADSSAKIHYLEAETRKNELELVDTWNHVKVAITLIAYIYIYIYIYI